MRELYSGTMAHSVFLQGAIIRVLTLGYVPEVRQYYGLVLFVFSDVLRRYCTRSSRYLRT